MGRKKKQRREIPLRHGLPEQFVDKLELVYSPSDVQLIISALRKTRPTTLRVNTVKGKVEDVQNFLRSRNINYGRVGGLPLAMTLSKATSREVTEWDFYKEGKIYLQNLSSQMPPIILAPKPGDVVLDLSAAPGSKTTQIAAMMELKGNLLANDINFPRFKRLEANCKMQMGEDSLAVCTKLAEFPGSRFLELQNLPGEVIGKKLENLFDKVLLDAPCSSEGQFEVDNQRSFGFWSRHKAKEMASKQKTLMVSALRAAKVGGLILYSTCTYAPQENEGVIDWALKKFPGVFTVEKIKLSMENVRPGITKFGEKTYANDVKNTLRILPGSGFEGFYVALLRKKDIIPPSLAFKRLG